MKAIVFTLLLATGYVQAEEKTCQLTGMHCTGCTEMVEGKVCGDGKKYTTCKARIVDEGKQMGEIHMVTKDPKGKIDEKALKAAVKDAGYVFKSCGGKEEAPKEKSKS